MFEVVKHLFLRAQDMENWATESCLYFYIILSSVQMCMLSSSVISGTDGFPPRTGLKESQCSSKKSAATAAYAVVKMGMGWQVDGVVFSEDMWADSFLHETNAKYKPFLSI